MNKAFHLEMQKVWLAEAISKQFECRVAEKGNLGEIVPKIEVVAKNNHLFVHFSADGEVNTLDIPLPFEEHGTILLEKNEVKRPLCTFFIRQTNKKVDYLTLVQRIIMGTDLEYLSEFVSKKLPFIQQIVNSFVYGNTSIAVYNLQRTINYIINQMPVHGTYMNSWAMNHRLVIIDPEFDELRSPDKRLKYQLDKADEYFERGWTAMGLSDGVLADKNYILTTDLRKTIPFGFSHHNPQRNLYSTLGMKGPEDSLVRTRSMEELRQKGLNRKGWNWFTAFADIPEVWEDQILLDNSLKDHYITYHRRIVAFGTPLVKEGDVVKKGTKICLSPDKQYKLIEFDADKIWIEKIAKKDVVVGGSKEASYTFVIKFNRRLKDGVKITNRAANKGVIRFKDLGYAECNGRKRKIEVLVSSQAVLKRKNYTQILEALLNNATGEKGAVIEDNYNPNMSAVKDALIRTGFRADGSWDCDTYAGKFPAVCGKVFWGVTMDVEDMLWDLHDTTRRNGRNLRTAGLKFSTVEFRALQTRFGKDNPVIDEIMSYAQGAEDLNELLKVLKCKRGDQLHENMISLKNVKPIDQTSGTIIPQEEIDGTIADDTFWAAGFLMKLPAPYQVMLNSDGKVTYEGFPAMDEELAIADGGKLVTLESIYVPHGNLRRCWRHDTGKFGLSEVAARLNSIVVTGHRFMANPEDGNLRASYYRSIYTYFSDIAFMLGSKTGEISVHAMAVRYPFSAKAVATLSCELPKNTVQIHRDMAKNLRIKNGDVVLVERFPCLGFMSIRPQKVVVTDDPMARYTIRVSKNSLGSLSLDFDGDVIYLASFHTKEAKRALLREFQNPNKTCYDAIKTLNEKMGVPHYKSMTVDDYNIIAFPALTKESHRAIVDKATGVKAHTGPVIALCYNIMRLTENSEIKSNQKVNVAVEMFLDKVGNSVFKQKHGIKSLHQIVTDAICTADSEILVREGFKRGTSEMICNILKQKATSLGVFDLKKYHKRAKKFGSNIISRLVKMQNKIYFASRSTLEGCVLLEHLESDAVDIPSKLFKWVLSGKADSLETALDRMEINNMLSTIADADFAEKVSVMCKYMDEVLVQSSKPVGRMMELLKKQRNKITLGKECEPWKDSILV